MGAGGRRRVALHGLTVKGPAGRRPGCAFEDCYHHFIFLGLSGDFSQLLSHGSGPRAVQGERNCDQRDVYLSFLFNIHFPVR